jgi:hypothetical protein
VKNGGDLYPNYWHGEQLDHELDTPHTIPYAHTSRTSRTCVACRSKVVPPPTPVRLRTGRGSVTREANYELTEFKRGGPVYEI